jgi:hypothetical protein
MPRLPDDPPNVEAEVSGPDMLPHDPAKGVPPGYLLGDDGKLYRRRIVSGVAAIALASSMAPGASRRAERVEAAMAAAINKAVSEGIAPGTPELTAIIMAARNAALNEEG